MKELVGHCSSCRKETYCLDGFGIVREEDQTLLCFDCVGGENSDD